MGKFETVNEVKSVTAHEVINRNVCFAVDRCNPGLTDLFLSQARRECAPAQEQKPSVRDSLNKNAGQQAHSDRTKAKKEPER